MFKKFFKNYGFTLFELLAVLAIMAIIAGIAVPRVTQTIKNARIEALKNNMQLIANSMQRYATEKELTSCIGGMFVINPNVLETEAESGDLFEYDGSDDPGAPDSDPSIHNVLIDPETDGVPDADSRAKEISDDYIEGGIPEHIRVIVYADEDGQGHIVVSYGDVDATPEDDSEDDVLLYNGITPQEMGADASATSFQFAKTFELEDGEGHNHKQ